MMTLVPCDLLPSFMQYLPLKKLINILTINKEINALVTKDIQVRKALWTLRPIILRLQASYQCRKLFVHRLKTDIEYRKCYLHVHETDNPHFCWKKPPPKCISTTGLHVLDDEVVLMKEFMDQFDTRHYSWILNHVIVSDDNLELV